MPQVWLLRAAAHEVQKRYEKVPACRADQAEDLAFSRIRDGEVQRKSLIFRSGIKVDVSVRPPARLVLNEAHRRKQFLPIDDYISTDQL